MYDPVLLRSRLPLCLLRGVRGGERRHVRLSVCTQPLAQPRHDLPVRRLVTAQIIVLPGTNKQHEVQLPPVRFADGI